MTRDHSQRGKGSRGFYFAMAVVFAVAAVIGFAPNSIAILEGTKTNPPLSIHVHAASMTAWLALLVAQTGLVSADKAALHMRLGVAGMFVAGVVTLLLLLIALPDLFDPETPLAVKIIQSKRLIFFIGGTGAAFYARKTQSETHKRLIFVSTFVVLDAAFFRMGFLPSLGMEQVSSIGHFWMSALIVPFVIHDLGTTRRVHRVWMITIPPILAMQVLAAYSW